MQIRAEVYACWLCMTKPASTAGSFNLPQTFWGFSRLLLFYFHACFSAVFCHSSDSFLVILVDCRRRTCLIEIGVLFSCSLANIIHSSFSPGEGEQLFDEGQKVKNSKPLFFFTLLWLFWICTCFHMKTNSIWANRRAAGLLN